MCFRLGFKVFLKFGMCPHITECQECVDPALDGEL